MYICNCHSKNVETPLTAIGRWQNHYYQPQLPKVSSTWFLDSFSFLGDVSAFCWLFLVKVQEYGMAFTMTGWIDSVKLLSVLKKHKSNNWQLDKCTDMNCDNHKMRTQKQPKDLMALAFELLITSS